MESGKPLIMDDGKFLSQLKTQVPNEREQYSADVNVCPHGVSLLSPCSCL